MISRRILLAILALTALVYLPGVVTHDFVSLDDLLLIVNNPKAHGISPELIWRIFTSYDPELYVPMTLLSYQIEYTIAGLHPFLYHLDNLLLHLGSVVLVFGILRRLTGHDDAALFVAGMFALHPLQAEAVSWAAARKDLLSGFLALLSLWMFLRYRDTGSTRFYWWSCGIFALALLSKVSVILLPFSIILLDGLSGDFRWRKGLREFGPFALIAALFGVIALFGKTLQLRELSMFVELLLAMKALTFYVWKFVLPVGLTVYHPQLVPVTIASTEFLGSIAAVAALTVLAVASRKRFPLATFGLAFAALAIAPSFSNFLKKDTLYFAADRYVYIGMIGLASALVTLLWPLLGKMTWRTRSGFFAMLLLLLSGASFAQARTWQGSTTLYERALRIHPGFSVALNNLGASTYAAGDVDRAVELYEQARLSDPSLTAAYNNLAMHHRNSGDAERALQMIKTGLEQIPADRPPFDEEVKAWNILGLLLDERGMREEALAAYRKAVERAPHSRDAHYNLAVTLQKHRILPAAREHFLIYLAMAPGDIDARYRLAAAEAEMGMLPEAARNLRIVVHKDPGYKQAAQHLDTMEKLMRQQR